MDAQRLALTFPSDMERVPEIGARARAFCEEGTLSEDDAAQIELCVVEAVNNAIEHAYGARPDQEITLTATRSAGAVSIAISDRGQPMPAGFLDLRAMNRLEFDPGDIPALPERGFGLAVIKQVMDEVSYWSDEGVNTLLLVLRLPHEPSPR